MILPPWIFAIALLNVIRRGGKSERSPCPQDCRALGSTRRHHCGRPPRSTTSGSLTRPLSISIAQRRWPLMQQLHDFEAKELHEPFNERKSLQAPAQSTAQIGKDS